MKISGQSKSIFRSILLAGLLGTALILTGCGYALVSAEDLMQLNTAPIEDLEEELDSEVETDPTQAERLKNQLLSVLNLDPGNDVEASSSLDSAASFFMDLILESEKDFPALEKELNELHTMKAGMTVAFLYDGELLSSEVGSQVLPAFSEEKPVGTHLAAISVSYGIKGERSAWLILAQYAS